MTAQDVLSPTSRPTRPLRVDPALENDERRLLGVLVVLSAIGAAVFYRFTLLLAVDGTVGVVLSVALSLAVHVGLVVRTVRRRRS